MIAQARLSEANRRLVLVPGPPAVQRIFELTSTHRVLEFATAPDARDQQPANTPSWNGATWSGRSAVVGPTLRDKLVRGRALK